MNKNKDKLNYMKKLLQVKGEWIDVGELQKNRQEVEEQVAKRSLWIS